VSKGCGKKAWIEENYSPVSKFDSESECFVVIIRNTTLVTNWYGYFMGDVPMEVSLELELLIAKPGGLVATSQVQ
jgi:hypothetical protein